jgi:hypothetical protein
MRIMNVLTIAALVIFSIGQPSTSGGDYECTAPVVCEPIVNPDGSTCLRCTDYCTGETVVCCAGEQCLISAVPE